MNLAYLREKRQQKGLNQREMAEIIGLSHVAYRYVETGKRNVSLSVLKKIATTLELDANKLLDLN